VNAGMNVGSFGVENVESEIDLETLVSIRVIEIWLGLFGQFLNVSEGVRQLNSIETCSIKEANGN
jgi:hypothetical protein